MKQLSALLLDSWDFCISLPSSDGCKIKVSSVAVGNASIVRKIDQERLLTYCKVSSTHNIFLSRVCMDSVQHEQVFSVAIAQQEQMNFEASHSLLLTVPHYHGLPSTVPHYHGLPSTVPPIMGYCQQYHTITGYHQPYHTIMGYC